MDTKNATMNVIGVGGCGCNLAKMFGLYGSKFKPNMMYINSSAAELEGLTKSPALVVGDGYGAARNPNQGKEIATDSINSAAISEFISSNVDIDADYVFNIIIHSLAGGTGGGFASTVLGSVVEYSERKSDSTIVINIDIAVLPDSTEPYPANANGLVALQDLYLTNIESKQASLIVVSNDKFRNKMGINNGGMYDEANKSIAVSLVRLFDFETILGVPKKGGLGTLDYSEFLKIMSPATPEGGIYSMYTYDPETNKYASMTSDLPFTRPKKAVILFKSNKSPDMKVVQKLSGIADFIVRKESSAAVKGDEIIILANGSPISEKWFDKELEKATSSASKMRSKTGNDKTMLKKVKGGKLID